MLNGIFSNKIETKAKLNISQAKKYFCRKYFHSPPPGVDTEKIFFFIQFYIIYILLLYYYYTEKNRLK